MTPALHALFDAQHAASRAQPETSLALRRDRLQRMRGLLQQHGAALAQAVQADFGVRSAPLTEIADMLLLREGVADALRHLPAWSRPRRVRTPLTLQPARAWIQRQPLGVVGVRLAAAAAATCRPTAVEPVKKRWSKGRPANSAASAASPLTTQNSSAVKCCATSSAVSAEVRGVRSLGLSITRLPAASAVAAGPSDSSSG